ncbi:MAG TPA: hypothetical protein VGB14_00330 [Acidimicrobiales bacterium]|jgi:hypothetical protein
MGYLERRAPYVAAHRADLGEVFEDIAVTVTSLHEATGATTVGSVFDRSRWDGVLRDRLLLRNKLTAVDFAADEAGDRLNPGDLDGFLISSAGLSAENINGTTEAALDEALTADEPDAELARVLGVLLGVRLDQVASSSVTTTSNFGSLIGARQAGRGVKRWVVNSGNPRAKHAAMNGSAVPLGSRFGNGMDYPGDPIGGADNNANCQCSMTFEGDD